MHKTIYLVLILILLLSFPIISVANQIDTNFLIQERLLSQSDVDEGIYKIFLGTNGRQALDIEDGSKEKGAQIQTWTYIGVEQQQFMIDITEDGYYTIKSLM